MNPLGETTISNNVSNFLKAFENPLMEEQTENNKNYPNMSDFSQELVMSLHHKENEEIRLAFGDAVALKESDVSFQYNNDTCNISNDPISTFWRPF